jgi:hypothetical protein
MECITGSPYMPKNPAWQEKLQNAGGDPRSEGFLVYRKMLGGLLQHELLLISFD